MRRARHRRSLIHEARAKAITSTGAAMNASGARPAIRQPVRTTDVAETHQVAGRNGSTSSPHPVPISTAKIETMIVGSDVFHTALPPQL